MCEDEPNRLPQRAPVDVRRIPIDLAVGVDVAQRHRHNARSGAQGWLKQGGMERLHCRAISGGALGKHRDVFATSQRFHNGSVGAGCIVPSATLDEDGSSARDQEPD
jgi:hypothetical protein